MIAKSWMSFRTSQLSQEFRVRKQEQTEKTFGGQEGWPMIAAVLILSLLRYITSIHPRSLSVSTVTVLREEVGDPRAACGAEVSMGKLEFRLGSPLGSLVLLLSSV